MAFKILAQVRHAGELPSGGWLQVVQRIGIWVHLKPLVQWLHSCSEVWWRVEHTSNTEVVSILQTAAGCQKA